MLALMLGALVATATPTIAPTPDQLITMPAAKRSAAPDMGAMVKMFDTIFPPQPAPDPTRLPLAHTTALALLPPDSLGKSMGGLIDGMFERVMQMRGSDFPGSKPAAKGLAPDQTLKQALAAKDPHFDERARLTRAAIMSEFARFSAILEPRLRDGVARAVARRFDQRQLTEINAFFATETGRAMGSQFLGLWFDPDLMRSMVAGMPEMIRLMPGSIERISAATAHLPKPPKPKPAKPSRPVAPRAKPTRT